PITVIRDDGAFRHSELMTRLMREAGELGADWVVPFDDDEFLVSAETLAERLGWVQRDGMLVRVVNFVQHRSTRRDSPRALLAMVPRREHPVEWGRAGELATAGQIAAVEAEWPRKIILRAGLDGSTAPDTHAATGIGELELADWSRFLHAPIRSPAALERWADQGRRLRGIAPPTANWQHFMMLGALEARPPAPQWRL